MSEHQPSSERFSNERFLGARPGRMIVKLAMACIIVGALFSHLGLGVFEFWENVFNWAKNLISTLGENIGEVALNLVTYLVLGAVIVVPIWLLVRLLRTRR